MGKIILKTCGLVAFIAVSVVILLWLELSPSPETTRGIALHDEIIAAVQKAKVNQAAIALDMSKVANFDWDHLWIFPGYTPYESIAAQTGFRPNLLCLGTVDENAFIVVFTLKNKLADHICFVNNNGITINFDDLPERRLPTGIYSTVPLERDKAKFTAEYHHEDNWDYYVLRPSK